MENRIVMVLPNEVVFDQCRAVQKQMLLEFPTYPAAADQALEIVKRHITQGAKIAISRGATARYLRDHLPIPVLEIPYSFFDFAYALQKAFSYSPRVAVIGLIDSYRLVNRVSEFVAQQNEEVFLTIVSDPSEIEEQLLNWATHGVTTFVGGSAVVASAVRQGYNGILVSSDAEQIEKTITTALYELRISVERQEQEQMLRSLFDCITDGIFAIDMQGCVTMANPRAQRYLGASLDCSAGQSVDRLLPESEIARTLREGITISGELIRCNGYFLALNASPIRAADQVCGAVAVMQEVNYIQRLDKEIRNKLLAKGHVAKFCFDDIIGCSPAIQLCKEMGRQYARVDSTVLITGETGTGKELFAQSIHNASRRREMPFVAVNCGAIPPALLESELFGYVKGAFTGARSEGKAGLFELAHQGTIFLDEIGELPPEIQGRLLRTIQEREIVRIGDDRVISVDVRIIAATNRNLTQEIAAGRFRADLFYRLNVLELALPPLRSRCGDIPELTGHLLSSAGQRLSIPVGRISHEALGFLCKADFPGNIRQLSNLLERAAVLSSGREIDQPMILRVFGETGLPLDKTTLAACSRERDRLLRKVEYSTILQALADTGNNKREAARRLGISPSTLWRKLKEFQ